MGSSSGAPLLVAHPSRGKEDLGDQRRLRWCCGVSSEGRWAEATAEAGRLAALAAPMIAVALLQLMMQVISTIMVGHLGEVPLAGAAIAGSLTNVSGFSVLMGLACGLETICGQAFGAEQYHKSASVTGLKSRFLVFILSSHLLVRKLVLHSRGKLFKGLAVSCGWLYLRLLWFVLNGGHMSCLFCFLGCYQMQHLKLLCSLYVSLQ
uniref:Protein DETOXIFICATION n=1 Tax=Zea mays TaxID=4577 RepID=C4J9Q6_MAIZE|nr:unknown [Zea mays]